MKKVLWLIVCLMTMVLSVNAQNWQTETTQGDELKGTSAKTMNIYTDDSGTFVFTNEDSYAFMVVTNEGIFDYDIDKYAKRTIVGLYDANNVLIEKLDLPLQRTFITSSHGKVMGCVKKNVGEKILSFIKSEKGYVRIIAGRYDRTDFDFKVPCLNN